MCGESSEESDTEGAVEDYIVQDVTPDKVIVY